MTTNALDELLAIAAALNANPMRAHTTWEADAQAMARLVEHLAVTGRLDMHPVFPEGHEPPDQVARMVGRSVQHHLSTPGPDRPALLPAPAQVIRATGAPAGELDTIVQVLTDDEYRHFRITVREVAPLNDDEAADRG